MNDASNTILLVEDDAATRTFLADNLTADGYELVVADGARPARRLLAGRLPDLLVIDVGLPDGNGLDVVRELRAGDRAVGRASSGMPILVLSGRAGELDRLRGLEQGGDDYVTKPFSYPELRLRVAGLLRRSQGRQADGRRRVGPLQVDLAGHEVRLRGRRVELSQKEFSLLRALSAEPGRVFSKEELLRTVWGFRSMGATRTLDSHACRLRQKLGRDGDRLVVNVWGVGYRLVDGADEERHP